MTNLLAAGPLLAVSAGAVVALLADAFIKREQKSHLAALSLVAIAAAFALSVLAWNKNYDFFGGSLRLDNLSLLLAGIFCVLVALVILIGLRYLPALDMNEGSYYPLLLLGLAGLLVMVSSTDLVAVFLGLEVLSVSSYALAGIRKRDDRSNEAAVKYFLLGSFAGAFLVFGIALLYGAGRSTDLAALAPSAGTEAGWLFLAGWAFLVVGLGFKIALAPFHTWAPDVYQGSPTPVTAFFSVGPKAAGLAVLFKAALSADASLSPGSPAAGLLAAIAVLTMVLGNLAALRQTSLKRLLAYSSIAHSGYLLLAVIARSWTGLVFYIVAYLFMNVGAFASIAALSRKGRDDVEIDDLAGVGIRSPWIGACLAVFLVSLAGFPPTAGFLAKFFVFSAAVREGQVGLVVVAVAATLISVYYYLRVIVVMYMTEPKGETGLEAVSPALTLVLFLCLLAVFELGLFPGNILIIIRRAAGGF